MKKRNKILLSIVKNFGLIALVALSIIIGMLIQQTLDRALLVEVAGALEGTTFNVEIDLNETLLVDRIQENLGIEIVRDRVDPQI